MPLTSADADRYISGLTKKQKRRWASIANSAMEGGADEQKAVRIATSKFEGQVPFNPVIRAAMEDAAKRGLPVDRKYDDDPAKHEKIRKCVEAGGSEVDCRKKCDEEMKAMAEAREMGEVEMEIFRAGTHNGEEFTEEDLEEIAQNFSSLKDEVRPKLKITHRDNQETIAGLASYGDITDVFTRAVSGAKRLFARVSNIPKEVIGFLKDRRFPERSIEIYPKFRLGTTDDGKLYRNVLKAIALLGHEMPAVPGMAPIKLSEDAERQVTVCIGEICFACEDELLKYQEEQAHLREVEALCNVVEKSFKN